MRAIGLGLSILAWAALAGAAGADEIPSCAWKYGLADVSLMPPGASAAAPSKFADIRKRGELSGVGYLNDDMLVIVSNERHGNANENLLQLFERHKDGFVLSGDQPVFSSAPAKTCRADLEGLAISDDAIYVTPSFSLGRRKDVDKAAFDRGTMYDKCDAQKSVWRLDYDAKRNTFSPEAAVLDLDRAIYAFGVLRPFAALPDKENGVDIEAIAVADDEIYLGLRGPVLTANPRSVPLAPVIVVTPGDRPASEIRYVALGGYGIRDMVHVSDDDGFLIIAGPNGRSNAPFILYKWDGKDAFDTSPAQSHATALCQLDTGAEGIAVRQLDDQSDYEMVVVYDQESESLKAQIGRLPKPIP